MRGDVYRLKSDRSAIDHEQKGGRFGVVLQSDDLYLSTTLIAPTSTSACEEDYRPEVTIQGLSTRVMVDQMAASASSRLGLRVANLTLREMQEIEVAVRLVLGLRA